MFKRVLYYLELLVVLVLAVNVTEAEIFALDGDRVTQSFWRSAAAQEADGQYGTDGYVLYGLNEADGVWTNAATYDAASVVVADPNLVSAVTDSAISLPAYISDISLAGATGRWSGNGNFGQIEDPLAPIDPNDPNSALTNTSVIAWGPDPYVFTITRSLSAAFRLTLICANGDGQVPTWTVTVDDGTEAVTATVTALASPNIVYQTFLIPSGDGPITVSVEADTVDGWIAGFAFDTAVTVVGSDTTTQSNWRTAAALELDGEYGTDGYVIYGLNEADSVWTDTATYDASSVLVADPNLVSAVTDSAISLPAYIDDISLAGATGRWSGNGNFGQIEDPEDPNLALTSTSVIAHGPDPYLFTITRTMDAAFRLTVICATGDGKVPEWTITVDDGSSVQTGTVTAVDSPNIVYQMFEIPVGSSPVTVSTEGDVVNGWIVGFAFDEEVGEMLSVEEIPGEATTPVPVDGAIIDGTWGWVLLEWEAGPFADSHDVFVGTDFNAVSAATVNDTDIYAGNTLNDFMIVGAGNGAIPDGLLPGTTYYWRVDEVNETNPSSPWQGIVWSFSTLGIGSDINTQSHWRTAASLEADGEYGTDGYVIYGLNEEEGKYKGTYDASTLIDSNDPGATLDSAISLPAYIADVSLANATGMWSGNGNFGQIEDPLDPNHALTSTSVIANGPDPYMFTITRTEEKAFRLTVICATGDGKKPVWTLTVSDGSETWVRSVPALDSPNIVYQVFEIPAGSSPVTISSEADIVNGWITGLAFDSE